MIGNVSISRNEDAGDRIYYKIKKHDLKTLEQVDSGAYALSMWDINQMKAIYDFKEIRLRCYKQWHKKQVDVVLTYVDELTTDRESSSFRENIQAGFRFLPDDQFGADLSQIGKSFRKGYRTSIYNHPLYVSSEWHVQIWSEKRMECGDSYTFAKFSSIGNWQYYIR